MKPLKRPMFRSGGPIKEGIMNGMQEPQAVNTVGSPLAPRGNDGRQQYGFPLLLGAAGRLLARPFGTFIAKQFARPGVTGSGNLIRSGLGRTRTMQPGESLTTTRNIFQPNVAGRYLLGSPEAKAIGAVVKGTGKFGAPIKKVAKGVASSPLALGSVVYYGGGALLPDGKPDPNDPRNVKPAGERGKSGAPGGGDPDMFLTPREKELSKDQKDKITKDRIEANRDRYYKLMGIDKMQKGAAYDSLIDASKIIQEEGGDLKGSIKSGNLQSRIIDAISKNLDKSTDLKRQIDAAILKGEIEKDIKASDPQAQKRSEYIDKQIQLADKQLAGGSLIENIQAGAKAAGGANSTTNVYNSVIRSLNIEPEVLKDTAETIKLRKTDDYTTDEALVKKIVEAENKGPGVYIIDKSVVLVDEQGNTRTLALG
jgi:hypothetical protein